MSRDVPPATLAAIRSATAPAAPDVVRWAPEVRDALLWPALARFAAETPEQAARRELGECLMREYVQALVLLTPHASMGNVFPVGGAQPTTGTASGPTPPAPEA